MSPQNCDSDIRMKVNDFHIVRHYYLGQLKKNRIERNFPLN